MVVIYQQEIQYHFYLDYKMHLQQPDQLSNYLYQPMYLILLDFYMPQSEIHLKCFVKIYLHVFQAICQKNNERKEFSSKKNSNINNFCC